MSAPHPAPLGIDVPADGRLPASVLRRAEHGFLRVAAPWLACSYERLLEGLSALADPVLGTPATTADTMFEALAHGTLNTLCRTLVLELHVAGLSGALHGETPEARFRSFVDRYRDAGAVSALFEEYPVLARSIAVTLERAVDARLEFAARLVADRAALHAVLGVPAPDDALTAFSEAGDPHRGGRTVVIATFASGARVVYKPKSLAVDLHLQELLLWCNARGWAPGFRAMGTIDRGDYGWQAFLSNDPCDDADAVARFYRRTGGLLAVLHTLAGTDVHFENLVATGEHPMLVDAETLFHPGLVGDGADPGTALVNADLATSVLGVGLLPERTSLVGGEVSVDLSGLGASGDQPSPQDVVYWADAGTDTMRLGRRRMPMPIGEHQPWRVGADGERTTPGFVAHTDAIVAGFRDMFRLLGAHRSALLAPDGPIARFAHDPIRIVFRPTQRYASLYRDSHHPDLLRTDADRDTHFARLWQEVTHRPELRPLVPVEQDALRWGDIPVFVTTPGSRDVTAGTGERFAALLPESGADAVRRRIDALGEDSLERQLWYVRAALAAGIPRGVPSVPILEPRPTTVSAPLDGARAIALRLEALARRGGGFASWVGEDTAADGTTSLRPIGADLYGGVSGIALFLAALRTCTGDDRHAALLGETLATLRAQIARRSGTRGIGAFSGWSGVVWALVELARHTGDASLLALAESLLDPISDGIDGDVHHDVIGGAAGAALALLALHAANGSPAALALARRCGERLLQTAVPAGPGVGWVVAAASPEPLAGMAHGVAGIALALDRLSAVTGDPRFAETARSALRYERTLYDPSTGRWSDLRSSSHADGPGAWCHGAPGIGLARLASPVVDPEMLGEIEASVRQTLAEGFAFNESLCHGAIGNLELVRAAGRALDRPEWTAAVATARDRILGRWRERGPLTGVLGGLEVPGLMTGLSGIGYGLLRFVDPTRVASVLVLAAGADR